MGAVTEVLLQI